MITRNFFTFIFGSLLSIIISSLTTSTLIGEMSHVWFILINQALGFGVAFILVTAYFWAVDACVRHDEG